MAVLNPVWLLTIYCALVLLAGLSVAVVIKHFETDSEPATVSAAGAIFVCNRVETISDETFCLTPPPKHAAK